MPRKSKDKELEINKVKKTSTKTKSSTAKKATTKTKAIAEKKTTEKAKPTTEKKTSTKAKTTTSKAKVTTKAKAVAKNKSTSTKTKSSTSAKKATPKTKVVKEAKKEAKTSIKKTATKPKAEAKNSTPSKRTKATKVSSKTKTATTKQTKTKTSTKSKKTTTPSLPVLEYYDLPYRYNHTVVKVLAQNPTTLFVYWDINDTDRKNFENNYGNNFFNITKPVLVVHNLTDNYSYEIDIDDFANNWYIRDCDTKCKYSVELGRRPIERTKDLDTNYINVAYSNTMEIPNDHILFFKENDKIYFKNIKTNKITEKTFKNSIYANNLREIYKDYSISENEDEFDLNAPSSNFLSSNVL